MIALIMLMMSANANAYELGTSQFCAMTNTGDLQCYYYTLSACMYAIRGRSDLTCVRH